MSEGGRFFFSHPIQYIDLNQFDKDVVEDYDITTDSENVPFLKSDVANLYNYLNKVCLSVSVSLCPTFKFRTLADFVEIHVQQPVGIVQNQINLAKYFFVSVTMCFDSQIQNI